VEGGGMKTIKPKKLTADDLTGKWKKRYDEYRFWLGGRKHKWEDANALALAKVLKEMRIEAERESAKEGRTLF
jgi:hypothetical protein